MENKKIENIDYIPAFLSHIIDLSLIFLGYFLLFFLISKIPNVSNLYSKHQIEAVSIQDKYKLENNIGYKIYSDDKEYDGKYKDYLKHTDEIGEYKVINYDSANISKEDATNYQTELNNDSNYRNERFLLALIEYEIRIISFVGISFILILIIPIFNKKRYTIGRLASKTILISQKKQFAASRWQILGRFFLAIIVPSLLAIYLNPILILFIVLAIDVITMLYKKNGRTIIDYLTKTKIINGASYITNKIETKQQNNLGGKQ